ncbi:MULTISPECIES: acetyl-CoA carboxylase biotin carboxyl carrier protein [unclassified Nitratiruptor]|uniref:acetyl-CoA carboxylase biotin carboxyl carrier protein n=1 Tax=unclassified Nitratiruptor TaxID=2624044 RepID=UPI001916CA04|nr:MULTISPECIES: acetyl-CoA carboxylase biotin carboxyl carrier protein [unclassified Nitratiruptor]BCD60945.1 acetyl-CoA carboxylase biotin carboxyl carrier protein [Nitratiruptor sp. YY08-10]BCD64877.1 acetyl-CoA carboxylase biotin carboxyl carrier protein [Nitratiruptor sp. YY08-14]
MDFKQIKELIKIFDKSGLSRLKIKEENFEIAMQKGAEVAVVQGEGTAPQPQVASAPVAATTSETTATEQPVHSAKGEYITSPMVGTFYRAPSPDSPPFVKVGDVVSKGQTIGIIEAMKIFNEIEAEFDCKILDILVEDGQPVEYDMPLFLVERV